MQEPGPHEVTLYLERLQRGEADAAGALLALVYDELRAIARRQMRLERGGHTLQPTALVHEAWLRLTAATEIDWKGRAHFLALAARAMRRVLCDHARALKSDRRAGDRRTAFRLEEHDVAEEVRVDDVLGIDEALTQLAGHHERAARVVELRFFGGLTLDETAHVLEVARSTVEEDWVFARAWLGRRLE